MPANENRAERGPEWSALPTRSFGLEEAVAHASDTASRVRARWGSALLEELSYRRPFLFSPVILGTGAAIWFAAPAEPDGRTMLSVCLMGGLIFVWLRHRHQALALVALSILIAGAGAFLARFETGRDAAPVLARPVTAWITARIMAREPAGNGNWRYRLKDLSSGLPMERGEAGIFHVTGRSPPAAIGEVVHGRAHLQPPAGPAAPGLFDPSFAAHFSGLAGTGYFLGRPQALPWPLPDAAEGWSDRAMLIIARLRARIGDHIRQTVGGDEGALAAALVTNEQRSISAEAIESLRRSGLAHIIAISGMNMVLAAGVFFVGLSSLLSLSVRLSQSVSTRKIAAAGAVLGTAAYYFLSGFALSAERAFIMMMISLVAVLAGRPAISLRSVAISALAILLISPSAVLSASFQLSFSGTLGLVAAYEAWARRRRRGAPPARHPSLRIAAALGSLLAGMMVTALVGGLSTALFSVAHFQRLPLTGFVANMMAAPFIDFLIMPMALGAMLAMPFGLDWPFLKLMGLGLSAVLHIAGMAAGAGGELAVRSIATSSFLLAGAGFLLFMLLRTGLRTVGLILMAAALTAALLSSPAPRPDLLLHEDGEIAGLVVDGRLALARNAASGFVTDQWQRMLGIADLVLPQAVEPDVEGRRDQARDRYRPLTDEEEAIERALMAETLDSAHPAQFLCKKNAWCVARKSGAMLAIVFNGIYAGIACDTADIVVARAGGDFRHCRSGALLVSHEILRITGSLAVTLTGDPRKPILQPAYAALERPWHERRKAALESLKGHGAALPPAIRDLLLPPVAAYPDATEEVLINDSGG